MQNALRDIMQNKGEAVKLLTKTEILQDVWMVGKKTVPSHVMRDLLAHDYVRSVKGINNKNTLLVTTDFGNGYLYNVTTLGTQAYETKNASTEA